MKTLAWILLVAAFGVPALLALWLFFPIFGGAALAYLFFGGGPLWLRKYLLVPLAYVILAAFLGWLAFTHFREPPPPSVAAGWTTSEASSVLGTQKPSNENFTIVSRRALLRELVVVNYYTQKVASAIDTLRTGESVFMSLNEKAQLDKANLGSALENVRAALANANGQTAKRNLLLPGELNDAVKAVTSELKTIASEVQNATPAQLGPLQDRLPGLLNHYGVDQLPTKIVQLENAIRETVGAKLESATMFVARFARKDESIAYEQETALRFNDWQAKSLDLSNFFAGLRSDASQSVEILIDGGKASEVSPTESTVTLPLGTKVVVVRSTITQRGASRPIVDSRYFLPGFRAIEVHWPRSAIPSIVANVRVPENPDRTWPWSVATGLGANFRGVEVPKNSFIFSTPAGTASDADGYSLVSLKDEKLTPQDLASNRTISIEVLPSWLSIGFVQKHKELLVREDAIVALVVAAGSFGFSFVVSLLGNNKKKKG